jgi:hypothetical protein
MVDPCLSFCHPLQVTSPAAEQQMLWQQLSCSTRSLHSSEHLPVSQPVQEAAHPHSCLASSAVCCIAWLAGGSSCKGRSCSSWQYTCSSNCASTQTKHRLLMLLHDRAGAAAILSAAAAAAGTVLQYVARAGRLRNLGVLYSMTPCRQLSSTCLRCYRMHQVASHSPQHPAAMVLDSSSSSSSGSGGRRHRLRLTWCCLGQHARHQGTSQCCCCSSCGAGC